VLENLFSTNDGSFQSRILALRIALLQNRLDEAVKHIAAATKFPNADRSITSEAGRTVATRILENPPSKSQLEIARAALDLVTDADAMLYALKGKVRLAQGLLVDSHDKSAEREIAVGNIGAAIDFYRMIKTDPSNNPEFELIDLDISEAFFLSANYRTDDEKKKADLQQSVKSAEMTLAKTETDPRGLGFSSYRPVAQLLATAGAYLQDPNSDPRPVFQGQLAGFADVSDRPHLSVSVPAGKQNVLIRVTQWSFASFDAAVCKMDEPERQVIIDLSALTKKKVNDPSRPPC